MASLIEKIAYYISGKSRHKKYTQFLALLKPSASDTIADIGVNTTEYSATDNYLEKHYPFPGFLTAVGLEDMRDFQKRYPAITTVSANGRALPFSDNQFDIAYSNAVIEHVGMRDDQCRFLTELYRIGKRGFLTTPNRLFPIELHTRLPLFHLLLSKKNFDRVVTLIGKPWAAGDYMTLLSEQELRALLDQAGIAKYTFTKNRFCGFPMTFTVTWDKQSPTA